MSAMIGKITVNKRRSMYQHTAFLRKCLSIARSDRLNRYALDVDGERGMNGGRDSYHLVDRGSDGDMSIGWYVDSRYTLYGRRSGVRILIREICHRRCPQLFSLLSMSMEVVSADKIR